MAVFSFHVFCVSRKTVLGGEDFLKRKRYYMDLSLWGNGIGAAPTPAPIVTDPNGSYTGRGEDPYEKPVQDADDL